MNTYISKELLTLLKLLTHICSSVASLMVCKIIASCAATRRASLHTMLRNEEHYMQDEIGGDFRTWDDALRKSTQQYRRLPYDLFTCNCHSFIANNLNRLGFQSGGWNVVNLAVFILPNGRWASKASMLPSILPFVLVFFLGGIFGGFTFLTFWSFTSVLIAWFLLGTYCFKNLIHCNMCFSYWYWFYFV